MFLYRDIFVRKFSQLWHHLWLTLSINFLTIIPKRISLKTHQIILQISTKKKTSNEKIFQNDSEAEVINNFDYFLFAGSTCSLGCWSSTGFENILIRFLFEREFVLIRIHVRSQLAGISFCDVSCCWIFGMLKKEAIEKSRLGSVRIPKNLNLNWL